MVSQPRLVILKNAAANVLRGASSAAVAVILPPLLTRQMSPEVYGAWALILQCSAHVGRLDFGIQTAVGRFVAHATERNDVEYRNRLISTAFALLLAACLVALIAAAGVAWMVPFIFPQMAPALYRQASVALLLVASSLALGLPAGVFNAVFIGQQRSEIPAFTVGGSRLVSAFLLVLAANAEASLPVMGAIIAGVNIASYAAQFALFRWLAGDMQLDLRLAGRGAAKELWSYCYSLTIWSFSMLLVTGLDLAIVGALDFAALPYYAVAASLVTFIAGLQTAVFGALLPSAAVLHARGNSVELGRLVITSSRYGIFLLLLTGLPLIVWAEPILRLWVGGTYAANGALFLRVLVVANIVRLSATPYSVALIGTGQQRLVTLSPLGEGVSNLVASLLLGHLLGAAGVAIGTLIGAMVGVLLHIVYNLPRTTTIHLSSRQFVTGAIFRPSLVAAPFLALTLIPSPDSPAAYLRVLPVSAALGASLAILWATGFEESERAWLRAAILGHHKSIRNCQ